MRRARILRQATIQHSSSVHRWQSTGTPSGHRTPQGHHREEDRGPGDAGSRTPPGMAISPVQGERAGAGLTGRPRLPASARIRSSRVTTVNSEYTSSAINALARWSASSVLTGSMGNALSARSHVGSAIARRSPPSRGCRQHPVSACRSADEIRRSCSARRSPTGRLHQRQARGHDDRRAVQCSPHDVADRLTQQPGEER